MRPPDSRSALCAVVFGFLGAAFLILGVVFGGLGLPVRGASSGWAFLPIGVVCLLIGLVCALAVRRRHRRERRLQSTGVAMPGTVIQVRHHVFINWNLEHFSSWPGRNGVDSGLLWKEPVPGLQHPTVYVDPSRPKLAWVDPDTVVLLA